MAHAPTWLTYGFLYLGAAVLAVPIARALGLGAIIGYLAAGIAIGPWGLGLVSNVQDILHFAEFGVVLMLFLVGLELQPSRLWSMRRPIFGLGSAQVLGCAALLWAVAWACGLPWRVALVGALGLALSSTAIALQVLAERNLMRTDSGQKAFSILLFRTWRPSPSSRCCRCWLPGRRARAARRSPTRPAAWRWRPRRSSAWWAGSCWAGACCCVRCCAGSRAAARRRSSRLRRCCWWSPRPC